MKTSLLPLPPVGESCLFSVESFTAEKYFGLPDSPASLVRYHANSLLKRTDLQALNSKDLMVVHGSEDRRVLLQNSLALSHNLVEQNIIFQQQVSRLQIADLLLRVVSSVKIFPGVGHNLHNINKYFIKILLNFFRRCFKDEIEEQYPDSQDLGLLEDISSWLR